MTDEQCVRLETLLQEGNALRREAIALQKISMEKAEQQLALAKEVNEKAMAVNHGALQMQKRAGKAIAALLSVAALLLLWLLYRLFF